MPVLTNPTIERILREPGGPQTIADSRAQFAMRTHQGSVRAENQDRVVVVLGLVGGERCLLGVVGDGIGGMPRGGEAAALGLAVMVSELFGSSRVTPPAAALELAFRASNDAVHKALAAKSGFVAAACLVTEHAAAMVYAGDARVYSIGADKHIIQQSKDDVLPGRSDLIQYVGIGDGFVPHVLPVPNGCSSLLLTTDGAHGAVNTRQLAALCTSSPAHSDLVERLVEVSLWFGGGDNSTALALGLKGISEFDPGPSLYVWTPSERYVLMPESLPQWKQRAAPRPSDGQKQYRDHQRGVSAQGGRTTETSPRAAGHKKPTVEFVFTDQRTEHKSATFGDVSAQAKPAGTDVAVLLVPASVEHGSSEQGDKLSPVDSGDIGTLVPPKDNDGAATAPHTSRDGESNDRPEQSQSTTTPRKE